MCEYKSLKKIRVCAEIRKGATLADAQVEACQLALAETVNVEFSFNGQRVEVLYNDLIGQVKVTECFGPQAAALLKVKNE
jgi:hypothetical protein